MSRTHKLTQKHMLPLVNFAFTKFVDPAARAAEDAAEAKFVDLFRNDVEKMVGPQVAFLKQAKLHNELTKIALPYHYPVEKVGKSFTRPDGVVVERDDQLVAMNTCGSRDFQITKIEQLNRFKNGASRPRAQDSYWEDRMNSIALATPLVWFENPMNLEFAFERNKTKNEHIEGYTLEINHRDTTAWVDGDAVDALIEFLEAARVRVQAEDKLWRAAIDVILAAPTMEELKKFWPEAALIEGDLFPKPVAQPNAVLVINDDTKKMLCANMGARGVESAACAA